jgi:hypothetical protein
MVPHGHREAEFTTFTSITVEPECPHAGDAEKMTGAAADRDAFDDEQRGTP